MRLPPSAPPTGTPRERRRWPTGRELTPADFDRRHRLVCLVVAAHLPVLAALAVLLGTGLARGLVDLVAPALLLGAAVAPLPRRLRACAATGALLWCSTLLVDLHPDAPELSFHLFVVVAVVALYQDWVTYGLAVLVAALQPVLAGSAVPDRAGGLWVWGLLHAAFVLAESAVLVVFWHASEVARDEQEELRDELVVGRRTVLARMDEANQIRDDLIGTVSHEFRTPLTGIRGAALTLLKRGERLDHASRAQLLHAVLDQQERLSRLLENMLTAAQATATDPTASAEVDAVAAEVAMLADAQRPEGPRVSVLVDTGTVARIDRQALHQVLANLVDNAQQHGAPGAVPILAGGHDETGAVWLTVSNEGTTLDRETAARLFEPFTQADNGPTRTREGLGMGLYVVKRLVEVYGGEVLLRSEGGWTTVELHLQPTGGADVPGPQSPLAPTRLPIPKVAAVASPPSSSCRPPL